MSTKQAPNPVAVLRGILEYVPVLWGDEVRAGMIQITVDANVIEDAIACVNTERMNHINDTFADTPLGAAILAAAEDTGVHPFPRESKTGHGTIGWRRTENYRGRWPCAYCGGKNGWHRLGCISNPGVEI